MDIEWVACDLDRECGKDIIADEMMALMAEGLGLERTNAVVARLKHVHPQAMAEPIRSTLQKDAPDWARKIIKERQVLAQAKQKAEAAEAVSADQRRIEKSRKVLDAVVSGKWDVAIADGYMTMRHYSDTESRKVQRKPLADMEPSLLHAAQAFTHLSATTDSVLELRDSLKKERSALAKSLPERASQIEEDQRRADDKIRKVLPIPPEWGQGLGR